MRLPESRRTRRSHAWIGLGGLVSIVALALGLIADSMNLFDKVKISLLGRTEVSTIRDRYGPDQISFARKAAFLDRYAALCFDGHETAGTVDLMDYYHIDIFRCGKDLLAARVSDSDGNAVMSEIDLPASAITKPLSTSGITYGISHAEAQPASTQPLERPRAVIARALCQKATAAILTIRYQLADGSCMDETVDKRTGAVVSRVNGVPCDCAAFR